MSTPTTIEKHDLILYASGVESHFKNHPEKLVAVERAIEALERGQAVVLLQDGKPTGTTMRAHGSRYIEEKIR